MTLSGPSVCSQKAWGGLLFTQDTSLSQCRGHGGKAEDTETRSPITPSVVQPFHPTLE